MVSNLFFYQIVLIALVWLFLMLSWLWPSEPTAVPPAPSKPVPPPRQRSKEPQPFPGLTCNVSSLPILEKGEQFLRVIGNFALFVATIKIAYSEKIPCLYFIYMRI
jgi:hypothetical protein